VKQVSPLRRKSAPPVEMTNLWRREGFAEVVE